MIILLLHDHLALLTTRQIEGSRGLLRTVIVRVKVLFIEHTDVLVARLMRSLTGLLLIMTCLLQKVGSLDRVIFGGGLFWCGPCRLDDEYGVRSLLLVVYGR